jgi:hypothetical protein
MVKPEQQNRATFNSKKLYPIIRRWAHDHLIAIRPVGSYVKKTNIIGNADIDLFISLKPSTPLTLKEIYDLLADFLRFNDLNVKKQNVSIRVDYKNVAIDLVPGRKQSGNTFDHSLYSRKSNSWIQTNVYKHISFVRQSKCRWEICALKIWRNLHKLHFPSFYIEMSVINAVKGYRKYKLSTTLERILGYLYDDFEEARIIDPANSNNIISDELNKSEKRAIKKAANSSLLAGSWSDVIW